MIYESDASEQEIAATALAGTAGSYPVPSHLVFRNAEMTLTVEPSRELLRVNPLDIVPQPFRLLLGMRSSPQRSWAEGSWQLDLRSEKYGATLERRGSGSTAASYTNPW